MKQKMMIIPALFVLVSLYLAFPPHAEAYLDPGTGSYILQILIAGLLSGLFMLKPLVNKIKSFFRKLRGRTKEHDSGDQF